MISFVIFVELIGGMENENERNEHFYAEREKDPGEKGMNRHASVPFLSLTVRRKVVSVLVYFS